MDDLDGIPRNSHEPNSLAALWKLIKTMASRISTLERAAPQRSMSLNDGDLTVTNGGRVRVTGGGAVEVHGESVQLGDGELVPATATMGTVEDVTTWPGRVFRVPGLFLRSTYGAIGAVRALAAGNGLVIESGTTPITYGPMADPKNVSQSTVVVTPDAATIGSSAFDATNPDSMTAQKSQSGAEFSHKGMLFELRKSTAPYGIASIGVTLEDPKLRLAATDGVDVSGPFTVDGLPVGGSVTSVNAKTGAVVLGKADIGLGSVDNTSDASKPVSTATQTALNGKAPTTHTHTTSQVTGLDTALAGKASTAVATTTTNGLMPSTDKAKLNAATPNATANALLQRDTSGRAKVDDPAVAADIATKGYVDAQIVAAAAITRYRMVPGTALPSTVTSTWTSMASDVTVPADLFGPGVAYKISVYGQVQANPVASRILSVRVIFNGTTPDGAKVNGIPGPNNGSISVVGDYLVPTSQAVTVNCQASAPFGGVPIGSGSDAPFFSITISPYIPL